MKKLLTLLLTLVMAVCLVNINNNHTKAEDDTSSNVTVDGVLQIEANGHLSLITTGGTEDLDDGVITHENTKTQLGIVSDYTNHILQLSNDLTGLKNYPFIINTIQNETIKLSKNITITRNEGINHYIIQSTADMKIDGGVNSNTLTLKMNSTTTCNAGILANRSTLTLSNVNLVVNGSFDFQCIAVNDLAIDDSSSVILKNEKTGGPGTLYVGGTLTIPNNYELLGSTNPDATEKDLKVATINTSTHVYEVDGSPANYIVIRPKQSTPEPSPSEPVVKDESCEKVIGPTWHWNNEKGVCEEYATVGTSTR